MAARRHASRAAAAAHPQIAKHVDAWAVTPAAAGDKASALNDLAAQLFVRRPILQLKGHPAPLPASVLLRSVRKPSLGALAKAPSAAGLFRAPSNSFVVIKFHPSFGYAGAASQPAPPPAHHHLLLLGTRPLARSHAPCCAPPASTHITRRLRRAT